VKDNWAHETNSEHYAELILSSFLSQLTGEILYVHFMQDNIMAHTMDASDEVFGA
jgi:hypothetical protein